MALPDADGCSSGAVDAVASDNSVVGDDSSDAFVQGVLKTLCAQQDEHQQLLDQTTCFQKYWSLQQQWNHCAHVNMFYRDKRDQIEKQYMEEDKQERLLREQADREKKKRRAEELAPMCEEFEGNRKKWSDVVKSLEECQKQLHGKWTGRLVANGEKRQKIIAVQDNKEVLRNALVLLQQSTEEAKQVKKEETASA